MFKEAEEIRKGFVIMADEFNMVIYKDKDKSNPDKTEENVTEILNRIIGRHNLKDIWWVMKGDEKVYMFLSIPKCYTRIDYIFISNKLIWRVVKTEVILIRVTDHACLNMDIKISCNYKEAKRWRWNTSIQQKKIIDKKKKWWKYGK